MSYQHDPGVDVVFSRISALEKGRAEDGKALAVCMDRTERHDGKIDSLDQEMKDVSHKVTRIEETVESGFRNLATSLAAMTVTLDGLKKSETKTVEWGAIIKFCSGVVVVVAACATVVKAVGLI